MTLRDVGLLDPPLVGTVAWSELAQLSSLTDLSLAVGAGRCVSCCAVLRYTVLQNMWQAYPWKAGCKQAKQAAEQDLRRVLQCLTGEQPHRDSGATAPRALLTLPTVSPASLFCCWLRF